MGAKKLAQRLNMPLTKAEYYVEKVNHILNKSSQYKSNLQRSIRQCKAFSLPDGFICKGADKFIDNNATTIINFPFQSGGGMILRSLVHNIKQRVDSGELKINLVATIHDAIFFSVDEGDYETITKVSNLMKEVANRVLQAPNDWSIKVGAPEIIKQDAIWTPENQFNSQFMELLNFNLE